VSWEPAWEQLSQAGKQNLVRSKSVLMLAGCKAVWKPWRLLWMNGVAVRFVNSGQTVVFVSLFNSMRGIVKGWVVPKLVLEEMKIGVFRYCWWLNPGRYFPTDFVTKLLQYTNAWQLKRQLKLITLTFTVSNANGWNGILKYLLSNHFK